MPVTVYNTDAGVDLVGIPSAEAVGSAAIGMAAQAAGITSAEAVGQPSITGGRKRNSAYRQREHLTQDEVFRLMESARDNRYGA